MNFFHSSFIFIINVPKLITQTNRIGLTDIWFFIPVSKEAFDCNKNYFRTASEQRRERTTYLYVISK